MANKPLPTLEVLRQLMTYDPETGKLSRITVDGVAKSIGHYDTIEEAIAARQSAAAKYHGEFARTA